MTMWKRVLGLSLAGAVALAAGCKGGKAPGEGAAGGGGGDKGGGGGGGGGGASEDDDEALGNKLQGYVECINGVTDRALDSRRRYYDWLKDPKTGPTGKETNVYGLYTLNSPDNCVKAMTAAVAAKPSLDKLDAAGKKYLDALNRLIPLIATANDYYDQKDYLDDKFAKAKEMHGPLYAAFEDFRNANNEMVVEYEKVDDELAERDLARMEREGGRNLPFIRQNILRYAKGLVRTGESDEAVLEELQAALDAYVKAHQELGDYVAKNPASTEHIFWWDSFTSEAKDLVAAGKNRVRRVRDKKPYDRGEKMRMDSAPQTVDGSPGQLIEAYNDLINASNNVKFNFGQ